MIDKHCFSLSMSNMWHSKLQKEKHFGLGELGVVFKCSFSISACGVYCLIGNAFEIMRKCAFSNHTNRIVDVCFYGSMNNVLKSYSGSGTEAPVSIKADDSYSVSDLSIQSRREGFK